MAAERGDVIAAVNLSKSFAGKNNRSVTALADLTFTVRAGGLTALIGPDGAGKTTLMRLICGLMTPTAGTLTVLGHDVAIESAVLQAKLSYMPQKFGLYEDLTVAENLNLYADLHGIGAKERQSRFAHLLAMTDLASFTDRLAGKLSGGMKQKLGLACTLVRSPALLLLDEPTVGVDPLSRRDLWDILQRLAREEHLSVFVSTAYMEEAELCGDVFVMNGGRFLAHGAPEEIRRLAEGRCGRVIPPPGTATRLLQSRLLDDTAHFVDAVPEGGAVRFIRAENAEESPVLKDLGLTAESLPPRLEDAFMLLLHGDASPAAAPLAAPPADPPSDIPCRVSSPDAPGTSPASSPTDAPERTAALFSAPSDAPIDIEVKNLVRKFGDFTAVANTSFTVRRGEVFGLLGPNGAGKTTTFRMLCGLLPATSGELSVAGVNLRTARIQARANVGYVAQKFSLYGNLSVTENLRFFGGAYGLKGAALERRLSAVLDEFELRGWENTRAENLPGGYKQRLSMAAALLHQPQILFLDEPTSGIDPLARRRFWRQITDLSARGTTIIITTHFMEEAEYCDRIIIQDQGRLLALGSPEEIRRRLGKEAATMNDIFLAIVEESRGAPQAPPSS
ncbi:MAG: ATP-binding cassette domain-containing protein [Negativicutes bacterium]